MNRSIDPFEHSADLLQTLRRVTGPGATEGYIDVRDMPKSQRRVGHRNTDTFIEGAEREVSELIQIAHVIGYVRDEFVDAAPRPPVVPTLLGALEFSIVHALDFYLSVRQRELVEELLNVAASDSPSIAVLEDLSQFAIYVETDAEVRAEMTAALDGFLPPGGSMRFRGAFWRTQALVPAFERVVRSALGDGQLTTRGTIDLRDSRESPSGDTALS